MQVRALAHRDDGWWAVEVPEIPGLFTEARRLDQIADLVKEAAVFMIGTDDLDVVVVPNVPAYDDLIDSAVGLRDRQQRLEREATAASRRAVSTLRHDAGLTTRDVASLLRITPQRVSQIEHAAKVSA